MQVITPPELWQLWLDPAVRDRGKLLSVLRPYPPDLMKMFEVSARLNVPANGSPGNSAPLPSRSS